MKEQNKAYFFALIAVLFWSTVSTAFKLALKELDFIQLLFVSTGVAVIITLVVLVLNGKFKVVLKSSSKDLLKSSLMALLNPFAYYLILLKAYSILPAQIAQPLNYTWPVLLVLLAAPILKQKIKFQSIIALLISFGGVLIISTQGNLSSLKIDQPFGVFLAIFSSVFWAFFWLLNVRDKRDEVVKLFFNFSFAFIYEIVIMSIFSKFSFHINTSFYAAIYVGFFELGITFIIWLKALKYTQSADKISNMIFIAPALALFFIHFLLNERIFYTTYIGLFLILLGVYIVNRKRKVEN